MNKLAFSKKIHLPSAIYYLGALLVFTALTWFIGAQYNKYGATALLLIALAYALFFTGIGIYFWKIKKEHTLGGIAIFLALALVPLIAYAFQDILGWWPGDNPGEYIDFYSWIRGGWLFMELCTITLTLVALHFMRLPFLTTILYVSLWLMSMDIVPFLLGPSYYRGREISYILFGLSALTAAFILDRNKRHEFASYGYFFGVTAFWIAITRMLTLMISKTYQAELWYFAYFLVNALFILLPSLIGRRIFLVFGTLGVVNYLTQLTYRRFEDSSIFPFILSIIGMLIIVAGILVHSYKDRRKDISHAKPVL